MTIFDYGVIAIIVGSVVVGMMRGLVVEVLSLGSWLISFWCAKQFAPALSVFVPQALSGAGLRLVAAFVLVFFIVWLASCLPRQPAWRDALFARPLEAVALQLRPWLPPTLADNLRYPENG
jgi:membrane protein required for colicin V production